jgi:hypothetical protein
MWVQSGFQGLQYVAVDQWKGSLWKPKQDIGIVKIFRWIFDENFTSVFNHISFNYVFDGIRKFWSRVGQYDE